MKISVIIPMYNEEKNVKSTLDEVLKLLKAKFKKWEVIVVDDGSTDQTKKIAEKMASLNPALKVISYQPNQGRGKALREGFKVASGEVIVTIDADLSYSSEHILKLVKVLREEPKTDIVIGSPYASEGKVVGVPLTRLFWSKYGNKFLSLIMPGNLTTYTGILRAYRKSVLDSLELQSTDKDIHLEILSKALALGYHAREIPATLEARKMGKSKFRLSATVISHILFSLFEKPALFFSFLGLIFILFGLAGGFYIIYLWRKIALNPDRPLMTLFALLIISGVQVFAFGILATQLVFLRNEVYRVQRGYLQLKKEIEEKESIRSLN